MELKKAKKDLNRACNEYLRLFCKKQDLQFEYWEGQIPTTVALFNKGKYFFSFMDIMFDLEFNIKEGLIKDYFKSCIQEQKVMSYYTYLRNVNYIRPNNKPDGDSVLPVHSGRDREGREEQPAGDKVPVLADGESPKQNLQKSKKDRNN